MDSLKKAKIQFWMMLALTLAFFLYVLSSPAGAYHGDVTSTTYRLNGGYCNNCDKLGNSLLYRLPVSPFSEKQAPVPYQTLVWPSLPTTAESLIKEANKRLAELMDASKPSEATMVASDWERFWTTFALILWAFGLITMLAGTAGVLTMPKSLDV